MLYYPIIYKIEDQNLFYNEHELNFYSLESPSNISATQQSLESCLKVIGENDILITLPTTKDQLIDQNNICKGYTEFFRSRYKTPELCMTFSGPNETILLITDHIPLSEVPQAIDSKSIIHKIKLTLNQLDKYHAPIKEVIISGLNPHSGENGLLGTEDIHVNKAIESLEREFSNTAFSGPIPGDTLHFYQKPESSQLLVYLYHDQGLAKFKALFQTIGVNQTLGLPFLRLSVDHGTAFDKYGKNLADARGCYYLLKYALKKWQIINEFKRN